MCVCVCVRERERECESACVCEWLTVAANTQCTESERRVTGRLKDMSSAEKVTTEREFKH